MGTERKAAAGQGSAQGDTAIGPCFSEKPPPSTSHSGCWKLTSSHGQGQVARVADSGVRIAFTRWALHETGKLAEGPTGVAAQALSWGQAGTRAQAQRAQGWLQIPTQQDRVVWERPSG